MNSICKGRNLWFKVLDHSGLAIDGSQEQWSLPVGRRDGEWMSFRNQTASNPNSIYQPGAPECIYGTWLVSNPKPICSTLQGAKIYVAQWKGKEIELERGLIWVPEVRLLREATNLDLKPFGIYRAFQQIL